MFLAVLISFGFWTTNPIVTTPMDEKNPAISSRHPPTTKVLYLAYEAWDSQNPDIFVSYTSSDETEFPWSEPVEITQDTALDINPTIDGILTWAVVLWQSSRRGNFDIMYSLFDGSSWSSPLFLTEGDEDEVNPSVVVYQDTAYATWESSGKIYFSMYNNGEWSTPIVVSDTGYSQNPDIAILWEGYLWIVWECLRNTTWDLKATFRRPTGDWADPRWLTNDTVREENPDIFLSDFGYSGPIDLLFERGGDIGMGYLLQDTVLYVPEATPNWFDIINTDSLEKYPHANYEYAGCCLTQWVTYSSNREGNWEVYFTWIDAYSENLSNNPGIDDKSVIASKVHKGSLQSWIIYESERNGNWDIYGAWAITGGGDVKENTVKRPKLVVDRPSIYPTVTTGDVFLYLGNTVPLKVSVNLYSANGRFIKNLFNGALYQRLIKLFLPHYLPQNIYFLKIKSDRGSTVNRVILTK